MGENESSSKSRYLDVLIEIAKHGLNDEVRMSTSNLASKIGLSQQSASRIMKKLEANELVSRKLFVDGSVIRLEPKGLDLLKSRYSELNRIFSRKKVEISGRLVSGVGQGKYFIGLKGYKKQFKEKLNFIPYSGTFNLKIDKKTQQQIKDIEFMLIEGFSNKKRSFGGLKCIKAKIEHKDKQIVAAIVKPFRTVHGEETLELIAPYYLRERLGLKDGDKLRIVV